MNAEIYFKSGSKTLEELETEEFKNKIKELSNDNVCVLYKTETSFAEGSLKKAVEQSQNDEEGIDLIIIADALLSDSRDEAEEFFKKMGIKKDTVRKICPVIKHPISKDSEEENQQPQEEPQKSGARFKEEPKKNKEKNNQPQEEVYEKHEIFAYTGRTGGKESIKIVLLPTAEAVEESFADIFYMGIYKAAINPDKKNGGFFRGIIPMKGDKPLEIVRKSILIIAVLTFIVSGTLLVNEIVIKPMIADNTNNAIKDLLISSENGDDDDYNAVAPKPKKIVVGETTVLPEFEDLLKANNDTVGWIKVPNTVIDNVVVQSQTSDHEYYLKRDFYGNYSDYGTVFMDYRSSIDSRNLILHGHHMNDGRMFANLLNYSDIDFYKKNPAFTYNSIYEKSKWKIISIFKTNTLEEHGEFFNYLRGDFNSDSDFLNYIYQVRERSLIDCPVDVNEDDTLITLSTCAYDFNDFRFVVVARKVREGETAKVDTSKATQNPNILYPDVWYRTYGGTAPKLTTFEEAYQNKEITWYDNPHNKKWSLTKEMIEAQKKAEAEKKAEEKKKAEEAAAEKKKQQEEAAAKAAAEKKKQQEAAAQKAAKASLSSANSSIKTSNTATKNAKSTYQSIQKTYSNTTEDYNNAKDAADKISSASTKEEINNIIKAITSAQKSVNKAKSSVTDKINDIKTYRTTAINSANSAVAYANEAIKSSSTVKTDAAKVKTQAAQNEENVKDYYTKSQTVLESLGKRIDVLNNRLEKANNKLKKIEEQSSSSKPVVDPDPPEPPESSEPSSTNPEDNSDPTPSDNEDNKPSE